MPRRGARKGAVLRGGARKGAGRKEKLEAASPKGELPLDYLLRVMRSSKTAPERRDWAAKTALSGTRAAAGGKKEAEAAAAVSAGQNTGWASDLDFDAGRPN
jgi:hypothetical protein